MFVMMIRGVFMNAWLRSLPSSVPEDLSSPSAIARFELDKVFPGIPVSLLLSSGMGDAYHIDRAENGWAITGGETGLLYGAYRLILDHISGSGFPLAISSSPRFAFRMIDCWDNMDGSVERGYSGRSLFFEDGRFSYDPVRIRELARLFASCGLNVLCINNVNVHEPAQRLLEDLLPDAAALADLFRPFGIRLMFSVDFSRPIHHGVGTADPLDPAVQAWWRDTASRVYSAIPDLAGFLVKADSEGRPGPFSYGRNHADGANMLADAVRPYSGTVVWRCFVYNCRQDWRDTHTDRPKAAFEHYAYLDGQFRDNVILQVKHGPFDFQVREPVSPLFFAMKNTSLAMELQLAQEYTGHQIDIYTMIPMWKELFEELPSDAVMSLAAVSNLGRDGNLTGHPLAAVNLYTFGLLAWDPSVDARSAVSRWISLTYGFSGDDLSSLTDILLCSRRVYEQYTAPLGIGWMVNPHDHYGPNPSGYEYDLWGTYHKADRNAIGIDRTDSGTDYLGQYPESYQQKYKDPATCPDLLLLFYHRLPYSFRMSDGRTMIQRIYDDHFDGYENAVRMAEDIARLPFPEPDRTEISRRMHLQIRNAKEWCDIINTFFHRLSGIDDERGRTIYP